MVRGSERKVPHIGTETRSRLLREAAVRNIGEEYWSMAERLNQPCRVRDDGPMGCKPLLLGSNKVHVWTDESTQRISIG